MFTNSPGLTGWGRMPQPNLPFDLFTVLSKGALLPQVPTGGQRVLLERKNNLEAIAFLDVIVVEVREGPINQTCTKGQNKKKLQKITKCKNTLQIASWVASVCPHSSHELFTARHTLHFHLAGDSFD